VTVRQGGSFDILAQHHSEPRVPKLQPKILSLLLIALPAAGQAPQAPQLSPQAAYAQVLQPLEITRRDMANWSDSELAAFVEAQSQARLACANRSPQTLSGEDLIALARLCSLGQQWSSVTAAATQYLATPNQPHQADAYAFQIDAALRIHDESAALAACHAMLAANLPFDPTVDAALTEPIHYYQLADPAGALSLAALREPLVLKAFTTPNALVPANTLNADALTYAALQQFAGDPAAAAQTVSDLDTTLATISNLPADQSIPIAETRRQYDLIGHHLPAIAPTTSLYAVSETPRINTDYGNSTVLLLFPPWCAQCIRMAQSTLPTLTRLAGQDIHIQPLLAQDPPPVAAPVDPAAHHHHPHAPNEPEVIEPKTAADLLHHTPTLIVPPATLKQFAATDFPLLIATDSTGIIRFVQPAPESALNPGDFLEQVAQHIATQWPRQPRKPAPTNH
jgi:hypothetical protein